MTKEELEKKYLIMKENAETLANRIDRAVDYIEKNNYVDTDIVLDILQYGRYEEGDDKE